MKQEAISNEFTQVQISKFKNTRPEDDFYVRKVKYIVHETSYQEHLCNLCAFNEMGKNCPREEGSKTPVCFANNRPDRKSVYYSKNQVKTLTWTND